MFCRFRHPICLLLILAVNVCLGQKTFNKNYRIEVASTDSTFIGTLYDDKTKRDSIAGQYDNSHQSARALERYLLQIENPGVTRDKNDFITVKLLNGEIIILIPDPNKEEADFTFEQELKPHHLLVFRVQWYEGNNYAVIDLTNGKKAYMLGRPCLSSDSKLLISTNCDIESSYSQNGFQLFEFVNRQLKIIWEYDPGSWGPEDVKWVDDNTIVSRVQLANGKRTYKKIRIELKAPYQPLSR